MTNTVRGMVRAALLGAVLASSAVYGGATLLGVAHADSPQVIEGCHWNGSTDWVYSDNTLCRGTGEDPTHDGYGRPACADGLMWVPLANGHAVCTSVRVESVKFGHRRR